MPPLSADDARGHRAVESERSADCHYPLAYFQLIGISQGGGGKIGLGVDPDHGNVSFLIPGDDFGFILLPIRQLDDDLGSVLDHMVVGQNRPVAVDDETGAEAALALGSARHRSAEKTP